MFAVPMEQVARIHASSGTTGRATVVGYTKNDLDTWARLGARCFRMAGVRPGMKVHNAYGYGLFTGGLGAHAAIEAAGATVIPMSGGQTDKQITLIEVFKPDAIAATPTYLLTIGDAMQKKGLDPRKTSLRYAILGAEPWTQEMRDELEDMFDLKASDIYGLSEVMGPGVAQECVETKDGLTVWEDHFYPEIIDPDTLQPVPDGEYGELVISSLTKEAFPIIRYRTHDITRLLPGTARSMRRIDRISARNDDMIILRGVNCFPSQFEEIITEDRLLRPRYQCVLSKRGRMDHLTLVVEHSSEATPDQIDASAAWLKKQIKERIGVTVGVEITDHVDCGEGKAKRIVDNRDQ